MTQDESDVLILGGGAIGLACALALLREGRGVRVLEQGAVGSGSSHGNCGTLTPSHAPPLPAPGMIGQALKWMLRPDSPLYVKPRFDPQLIDWLLRFAGRCNARDWRKATQAKASLLLASQSLLAALVRDDGLDCEYAPSGVLYVYRDAAALERASRDLPMLDELGIRSEVWESARLEREEPALRPGLAGAVHYPDDACLRPDRYVAELARAVRAAGGEIEEGCRAIGFETDGERIDCVQTERGPRRGREVLLALGAWSPRLARLLGVSLPIQPGKGYSITWSRPKQVPTRPLTLKERAVCVTAWRDGFRLGSTMEFSGYDDSLNRTRLDALVRGAHEYLRDPVGPEKREEWYGWRPMTWDDLPIIGRAPRWGNLWLATGHGMLGISMSAITGRLIADLVTGRAPAVDPAACSPARFS